MPRWLLGLDDFLDAGTSSLISRHAANISKALETTDYIECGWPCYGAIPNFADQIDGRCRVIRLLWLHAGTMGKPQLTTRLERRRY